METFHENILQTFIFCFLASLGIIQIMVARKGWHGLSIYGGRVRKNVNYALGAALIIFAYAWYFSNPEHRNMRNIEGFMSMVCLVLGIMAALAATAIIASACEALRRRRGHGGVNGDLAELYLPEGVALLSTSWGIAGRNLVVIAEPGRGSEKVLRRMHAALPREWGFLSLQLSPQGSYDPSACVTDQWAGQVTGMLRHVEELEDIRLEKETFVSLGWASNGLFRLRPELENAYRPRQFLAVAPVIPDYRREFIGDALLSNTPLDILDTLLREKPWREGYFPAITRLWLPILVFCVILATLVTFIFDIRWKLFSGPLVGAVLSIWITYFAALWRGVTAEDGGPEARAVSRMRSLQPAAGKLPLRVVVISEDFTSPQAGSEAVKHLDPKARIEFWEDVLRGKFLLKEGTLRRMGNLILGRQERAPE